MKIKLVSGYDFEGSVEELKHLKATRPELFVVSKKILSQEEINEFSCDQLDELFKNGIITDDECSKAKQYLRDCYIECKTRIEVSLETNYYVKMPSHLLRMYDDLIPLVARQEITTDMYYSELERRAIIQNKYNQLLSNNYKPNSLINRTIFFANFVVLSNVFKCNKNHHIEQIQAIINILTPSGTITKHQITAGYCNECGIYFILQEDYYKLSQSGVLLCRKLEREVYEQKGDLITSGEEFNPESLLHQIGYNVNSQENLTFEQRQNLLKLAIDNNLYSVSGLLSFLDWLIARSKKVSSRDMSQAISKWKDDRDFVAHYEETEQRHVAIETIYAPK